VEFSAPQKSNLQVYQFTNRRGLTIVFNEDEDDINDYNYAIGDCYEVDLCFLF